MTDTSTAPSTGATILTDIDNAVKLLNNILPTAAGFAAMIDPAISPAVTIVESLLTALGKEIDIASQDVSSGKSLGEIVQDLINGLPSQQAAATTGS